MPLISFISPGNIRKILAFLTLSGGIEGDQWHEIVQLEVLEDFTVKFFLQQTSQLWCVFHTLIQHIHIDYPIYR